MFTRILVAACWTALFPFWMGSALAQNISGTISGTVSDSTGATVAGASLTLTNEETGDSLRQSSDGDGAFIFPAVRQGRYSLSVDARGFKRLEKKNLVLTATERLDAGRLVLEVGQVNESVT